MGVIPPPVIQDTSIEPPFDIAQRQQEARIADLLAQGNATEVEQRLTIPEDNSAVFYYREILAQDG